MSRPEFWWWNSSLSPLMPSTQFLIVTITNYSLFYIEEIGRPFNYKHSWDFVWLINMATTTLWTIGILHNSLPAVFSAFGGSRGHILRGKQKDSWWMVSYKLIVHFRRNLLVNVFKARVMPSALYRRLKRRCHKTNSSGYPVTFQIFTLSRTRLLSKTNGED